MTRALLLEGSRFVEHARLRGMETHETGQGAFQRPEGLNDDWKSVKKHFDKLIHISQYIGGLDT